MIGAVINFFLPLVIMDFFFVLILYFLAELLKGLHNFLPLSAFPHSIKFLTKIYTSFCGRSSESMTMLVVLCTSMVVSPCVMSNYVANAINAHNVNATPSQSY